MIDAAAIYVKHGWVHFCFKPIYKIDYHDFK